jgi:DNA-binding transcriptional MerR regulator
VSVDTIRYYERVGLLPPPPRSHAGYRRYSDDAVARIVFVRSAARFGFALKELAGFLRARQQGRPPCRSVRAAGERLLQDLDRRIAELQTARATMAATLAEWDVRLAAGEPARLLETLTVPHPHNARHSAISSAHGTPNARRSGPSAGPRDLHRERR